MQKYRETNRYQTDEYDPHNKQHNNQNNTNKMCKHALICFGTSREQPIELVWLCVHVCVFLCGCCVSERERCMRAPLILARERERERESGFKRVSLPASAVSAKLMFCLVTVGRITLCTPLFRGAEHYLYKHWQSGSTV